MLGGHGHSHHSSTPAPPRPSDWHLVTPFPGAVPGARAGELETGPRRADGVPRWQ